MVKKAIALKSRPSCSPVPLLTVCANFDSGCYGFWSASEQSQLCAWSQEPTYRFTTQEFSMVDSYTAELKNHKTVKIGGWALAETIRYFMPSILSQIHSS